MAVARSRGIPLRAAQPGLQATLARLAEFLRRTPDGLVVFSGHSLGSAVAEVAFLWFVLETLTPDERNFYVSTARVHFVGFASPVIGTKNLARIVARAVDAVAAVDITDNRAAGGGGECAGMSAAVHHFQTEHDVVPLLTNAMHSLPELELDVATSVRELAAEVTYRTVVRSVRTLLTKGGQTGSYLDFGLGGGAYGAVQATRALAFVGAQQLSRSKMLLPLCKAHGRWYQHLPNATTKAAKNVPPSAERVDDFAIFSLLLRRDATVDAHSDWEAMIHAIGKFDAHQIYNETTSADVAVLRVEHHLIDAYRDALAPYLMTPTCADEIASSAKMPRPVRPSLLPATAVRYRSGAARLIDGAADVLDGCLNEIANDPDVAIRTKNTSKSVTVGAIVGAFAFGAAAMVTGGGLAVPAIAAVGVGLYAGDRTQKAHREAEAARLQRVLDKFPTLAEITTDVDGESDRREGGGDQQRQGAPSSASGSWEGGEFKVRRSQLLARLSLMSDADRLVIFQMLQMQA